MTAKCDGTIEHCGFRTKIEALWDALNFIKGVAWVLGGLNVLTIALLVAMFSWMLGHVRFDASPTASAPTALHEAQNVQVRAGK
jgi:hypothetical protein